MIADEPTTALDVSIQAQIITLLKDLTRDHGTAVMLVTHDMGVIAETADRVAVMYAGRIVEIGPVAAVIRQPAHPYTEGLMASIPSLEHRVDAAAADRRRDAAAGCASRRLPLSSALPARVRALRGATAGADGGRRHRRRLLAARHAARCLSATLEAVGVSHFFDVSRPLLQRLSAREPRRWLRAVDDVSFKIARGTTFALVGESGCGKSTIARLAVGLYQPERRATSGSRARRCPPPAHSRRCGGG